MKIPQCEKVVLANSLGIKLVFCQACNVVELEIGAVSVRLCPDVVQQVANVMMKASLQDITPGFDSDRMAAEYYEKLYSLPLY